MEQHCDLPAAPEAAGVARRLVREVLTDLDAGHVMDDAMLVMSELATNAVRYGAAPIRATATVEGTHLILAVQDSRASDLPYPKVLTATEPNGRGMHLVAAMASRWGWDRSAHSKVVWAEIPLDRD
jgi:anti-sigma regulatory factor (Ser/Thr protein kinase)